MKRGQDDDRKELERMVASHADWRREDAYEAARNTTSLLGAFTQLDMLAAAPMLAWSRAIYDERVRLHDDIDHSSAAERAAAFEELEDLKRSPNTTSEKARAVLDLLAGHLHENGFAGPPDSAAAARFYRSAADHGCAAAQYVVGITTADPVSRARVFALAAGQDHSSAMCRLASAYRYGVGVERNAEEMLRLLRLSIDRSDPIAALNLAMAHLDGELVPHDDSEVVRILSADWVVRSGYPIVSTTLGTMYLRGIGTQRDMARGIALYRSAAERGDGNAFAVLSDIHMHDRHGVKADVPEAVRLLRVGSSNRGQNASHACLVRLGRLAITGELPDHVPHDARAGTAIIRAAHAMTIAGCAASPADQFLAASILATLTAV